MLIAGFNCYGRCEYEQVFEHLQMNWYYIPYHNHSKKHDHYKQELLYFKYQRCMLLNNKDEQFDSDFSWEWRRLLYT